METSLSFSQQPFTSLKSYFNSKILLWWMLRKPGWLLKEQTSHFPLFPLQPWLQESCRIISFFFLLPIFHAFSKKLYWHKDSWVLPKCEINFLFFFKNIIYKSPYFYSFPNACIYISICIYMYVYIEGWKGGGRGNFSAFNSNGCFPSSVFHKIYPEVLRYWRVLGFSSTATLLRLWQPQIFIYISEFFSVLTVRYHLPIFQCADLFH